MADDAVEVVEKKEEVPLDKTPTIKEYKAGKAALAKATEEKAVESAKVAIEEEVETEEEEHPADGTGDSTPEKTKGKGGFQKRIDRLIKQNAATEEQLEKERKARQELEAKGGKVEERAAPAGDAEPDRKDFDSDAAYLKAMVRYGVEQTLREIKESQARTDAEAHQKQVITSYNERVIEAKSRLEDWDTVMSQEMELPRAVGMAILRMPNGPDVAYHLGKNPEVAEELMGMDEEEARGMAWQISRELGGDKAAEVKTEEKLAKKLPAPIRAVGSSGNGTSTIPLDKVQSMAEYRKRRAAGQSH